MTGRDRRAALLLLCLFLHAGCAASSKVTDFKGLTTPYGRPLAHIHCTRVAVHLFGRYRLLGNASVYKVTDDFLNRAKELEAKKIHIDHTDRTAFWFGFPPFTLILTPVVSSISGAALE